VWYLMILSVVNVTLDTVKSLVLPRTKMWVYSQLRIVKKKSPVDKLTSVASSLSDDLEAWA
jgi:hypothetical protein